MGGADEADALPGCTLDRVVRGLTEEQAREAVSIWYDSFGLKLAGLLLPEGREDGERLAAASLVAAELYAALDRRGRVLGVAIVTGHAPTLILDEAVARDVFSAWGAWVRLSVYRLVRGRTPKPYPREDRGLEGFAVREECRGKGVGAAMIERIASDARAEGAHAIELNVGENNPARRLYERAGFVQTRTQWVGPFAQAAGLQSLRLLRARLGAAAPKGGD